MKNPVPYGGQEILQQIKVAKNSGVTTLILRGNNITDLSPLSGLTNLTALFSRQKQHLQPNSTF